MVQGIYDRIHVGAACPPNRVAVLRKLLKPSGGIIVTPVAPSDLQRINVNAEGHVRIETLSQVRYSNLEVSLDPAQYLIRDSAGLRLLVGGVLLA